MCVCVCVCVCKRVSMFFIRDHPGMSNKEQGPARHEVLERREMPLEKASEEAVTLGRVKFQ